MDERSSALVPVLAIRAQVLVASFTHVHFPSGGPRYAQLLPFQSGPAPRQIPHLTLNKLEQTKQNKTKPSQEKKKEAMIIRQTII